MTLLAVVLLVVGGIVFFRVIASLLGLLFTLIGWAIKLAFIAFVALLLARLALAWTPL